MSGMRYFVMMLVQMTLFSTVGLWSFFKTPFKKENEMLKNDETIVLNFLYNRLIEKYGENENYDYMIKFREIINSRSIG